MQGIWFSSCLLPDSNAKLMPYPIAHLARAYRMYDRQYYGTLSSSFASFYGGMWRMNTGLIASFLTLRMKKDKQIIFYLGSHVTYCRDHAIIL